MNAPTPTDYQPRLGWWGHTWRILLMALLSFLVLVSLDDPDGSGWDSMAWVDLGLGVLALVLTFWRRRWPLPVATVVVVISAFSACAAGPATLVTVSAATSRRWGPVVYLVAINLVAAEAFQRLRPMPTSDPYLVTAGVNVAVVAALVAWGMYIGSRRELLWTLRHRAERAESEQELRVREARANERARIAREMHDVLAHRISQVSMHAGAMAFRADLSAEEMRTSAGVVQQQAHQALTDLRGVLGVLRDDTTGERVEAPQPTWDDVPRLVEEARAAGLEVRFHDDLGADPVPDSVGRTLYRMIQEGMTNARKHAPGAVLTVEVTGSPDDGVTLRLRNPLGFGRSSAPGAGLGLIGLAERAELRGGRLRHGTTDGAFVVDGWIPWAA